MSQQKLQTATMTTMKLLATRHLLRNQGIPNSRTSTKSQSKPKELTLEIEVASSGEAEKYD